MQTPSHMPTAASPAATAAYVLPAVNPLPATAASHGAALCESNPGDTPQACSRSSQVTMDTRRGQQR